MVATTVDTSLLGLYDNPDAGADAIDGLRQAGFDPDDYDVLTGTPYPEGAFGEHVSQHRLFRFPLFGAMIGFTIAVLYTAGTQLAYPLVTGGKPILAIPPMLIIHKKNNVRPFLTRGQSCMNDAWHADDKPRCGNAAGSKKLSTILFFHFHLSCTKISTGPSNPDGSSLS